MKNSMTSENNKRVVEMMSDVVSGIFNDIDPLPLSEQSKMVLTMIVASTAMERDGNIIKFKPLKQLSVSSTAKAKKTNDGVETEIISPNNSDKEVVKGTWH